MKSVGVVMGSASDASVMEGAVEALREFGVPLEVRVLSAHRTPDDALQFARDAEGRGFGVLIAGAGKAAHLAGVLAAVTSLPVIGVPIASGASAGSMRCWPWRRCPPAFPSPPWPSTGPATPGSWPFGSWRSPTRGWPTPT